MDTVYIVFVVIGMIIVVASFCILAVNEGDEAGTVFLFLCIGIVVMLVSYHSGLKKHFLGKPCLVKDLTANEIYEVDDRAKFLILKNGEGENLVLKRTDSDFPTGSFVKIFVCEEKTNETSAQKKKIKSLSTTH